MTEIWRYTNIGEYEVSSFGRCRNRKTQYILKGCKLKNNYWAVSFCFNGKQKTFLVHKLVALAFPEICGEYTKGLDVMHLDGSRDNNYATNLRFGSRKDNMNHPLFKVRSSMSHIGIQYGSRKKIASMKNGEVVKIYPSVGDASIDCRGDTKGTGNICSCLKGNQKTAYGYTWKYID